MPTRKLHQRNIRNLTRMGAGSFGITLPIDLIRKLGWRERQKLVVTPKGRKITIKDWNN